MEANGPTGFNSQIVIMSQKLMGKNVLKIAFLAWGSLVWNPGGLKISGKWEKDGPCLPIEFARISNNKRLTLVIYPSATKVKTLWAYSAREGLQESICDLAKRERTDIKNIGFISIEDGKNLCSVTRSILPTIESWAKQKDIDAVVWTDLSSTFKDLTPDNVIRYLRRLGASASLDAETYVRKAPEQINTKIRAVLKREFGWTYVSAQKEYDWSELKEDFESRIVDKSSDDSYWVVVPDKPATFGHLLVISWRGYQKQDITDKGLFRDDNHMRGIMRVIHDLAFEMKSCLTSNGEANGKKCEKVYLVSECETENFPFHFHLIPRFECEKAGHLYLFKQELEETRWVLKKGQEDRQIQKGRVRVSEAEDSLIYHKSLFLSNKWARSNPEREEFVGKVVKWWNKHWTLNEQCAQAYNVSRKKV